MHTVKWFLKETCSFTDYHSIPKGYTCSKSSFMKNAEQMNAGIPD